jgi:hypothetical protein
MSTVESHSSGKKISQFLHDGQASLRVEPLRKGLSTQSTHADCTHVLHAPLE